jgi:hypothetical protein
MKNHRRNKRKKLQRRRRGGTAVHKLNIFFEKARLIEDAVIAAKGRHSDVRPGSMSKSPHSGPGIVIAAIVSAVEQTLMVDGILGFPARSPKVRP